MASYPKTRYEQFEQKRRRPLSPGVVVISALDPEFHALLEEVGGKTVASVMLGDNERTITAYYRAHLRRKNAEKRNQQQQV